MGGRHTYLGTDLSPGDYYRRHAGRYHNPHAKGVERLLSLLAHHLEGKLLDLGCGDGLVTKLLVSRGLTGFVGADSAEGMVERYRAETGFAAVVAGFGDVLPEADCAVASYALHLCPPSEVARAWFRLWEAGCKSVVIVGPFKDKPAEPQGFFELAEAVSGPFGPDEKTLHGRAYRRLLPQGSSSMAGCYPEAAAPWLTVTPRQQLL